ncbi:GNAT family N-acetyltransferase [Planomicrobium sp. CPCC 101079]|uniref:GNAT family N-acetyltransferase n=1 Tax=Planomicrobium sp. CPCC 101079 TaxID=2599618 RepID=UPI0011B76171|nr:GNAT family N-acetyltransferase [Planomicrobium sp. CPCC 101079]TWT09295.1 GNAT family N-acetyltransferase [Planomicrobium sp. CPCC 101079]
MIVRQAKPAEFKHIYKQGYSEWAKGRSFEEYLKDNQKEEQNGIRYVLVNDEEQLIASLIMLEFRPNLFGIGSIVVDPAFRSRGLGKKLIEECLEKHSDAAFILYSEIEPSYYEQFGFRVLPNDLQQSSKGTCMIRAKEETYEKTLQAPLPGYF